MILFLGHRMPKRIFQADGRIIPDVKRVKYSRGGNTVRQILNRQKGHLDPFFRSHAPAKTQKH